jgi:hypothetical protein
MTCITYEKIHKTSSMSSITKGIDLVVEMKTKLYIPTSNCYKNGFVSSITMR